MFRISSFFPRAVGRQASSLMAHPIKVNSSLETISKDFFCRLLTTQITKKENAGVNLVTNTNVQKVSKAYQNLSSLYYEIDKPLAPKNELEMYLFKAKECRGAILEPMCGNGRFLVPMLKNGHDAFGFDNSKQMLHFCDKKFEVEGLNRNRISCADFQSFVPTTRYGMIFIPTGSLCLLTSEDSVDFAFKQMHSWLEKYGRLYFEVDMVASAVTNPGAWTTRWVDREDGGKIVLSMASFFSENTSIQKSLLKYELWENNEISKTEVEEFNIRLYTTQTIENMIKKHGFRILKRTQTFSDCAVGDKEPYILYHCEKP